MRKETKTYKKYCIGHSSYIHNDVHLGLLIKIGKTQNERIMAQTIIRTFKKPTGEGGTREASIVKNGDAQMVIVLTTKETSYLVVGVFDCL